MKRNYFDRFSQIGTNRLDEIISLQWGALKNNIHLIASASYPFPSVLRAMSAPSFVFPAEGMPGARYLPGAEIMDYVENEGETLVLNLFSSPRGYRATLQPHSGTQANQIAYNSVLKHNDVVLCLKPKDGGHISHTVLISRRNRTYNYGLTSQGGINYEQLRKLAKKHRPKLIIIGGSALPREIDFRLCSEIAQECGAFLHGDISHTATFVAADIHRPVFPYCDFVTFNTVKNLRGPNSGVLIYRDSLETQVHRSVFPTTQGGANETAMLGKLAVLLEWTRNDLPAYARKIVSSAKTLAKVLTDSGLHLTTGGTDCHILLIELHNNKLSGLDLERVFEKAGVLLNKNLVPNDRRPPSITSGLRIGATNLAILDYTTDDITKLGEWISDTIITGRPEKALIDSLIKKYYWNPENISES